VNDHLLAENEGGLLLEILPESGPVDKLGRQQRNNQRNRHQSANKYQYPAKHPEITPS
jgi:hypothetical protein